MDPRVRQEGGVQVLELGRQLIEANAPTLRSLVERLLEEDHRDYVLECAALQEIDSAGLEVLTWMKRASEERLGGVRLSQVQEPLTTILMLTRLQDRLPAHGDTATAVASFG